MIQQKSFNDWNFKNEIDLMICDIPFGINFSGKPSNYNRNSNLVVDGYVEWRTEEIIPNLSSLFISAKKYLKPTGSLLIFSGWQISNNISKINHKAFSLIHQGKLYWNYNFSPYCSLRPNTNCYEIFWFTRSKKWFYNNKCSQNHCQNGEANLSVLESNMNPIDILNVKKEYLKGIPKYPTRFPSLVVKILIEHFSDKNSTILDPLCGSGITGVICKLFYPDRTVFLGDLNPYSQTVFNELLKFFNYYTLEVTT
jgi:site-specific DNA-methyltransferase (adenine-specific)